MNMIKFALFVIAHLHNSLQSRLKKSEFFKRFNIDLYKCRKCNHD